MSSKECSGFLVLEEGGGPGKRGYFVLNGIVLERYEENGQPDWIVPLLCCSVRGEGTQLCFRISPLNLRFFCETAADLAKWTNALNKVLTRSVEDYYDIGKTLGEGKNGKVKLAKSKQTGEHVAIKVTEMTNLEALQLLDMLVDVLILFCVDHEGIVKPYDYFESDEHVYLVMEYLEGGTLEDRVLSEGKLTEEQIRGIMRSILSGVNSLHEVNIVHRDIKIDNIVCAAQNLDSGKLIDLGSGAAVEGELVSTCASAIYYLSPEQVMRKPYTTAVDLWACGVVLYWLVTLEHPFDEDLPGEVLRKIHSHDFKFGVEWNSYSLELKNFCNSLLQPDPKKRLTAAQALASPLLAVPNGKTPVAIAPATIPSTRGTTGPARTLLQNLRSASANPEQVGRTQTALSPPLSPITRGGLSPATSASENDGPNSALAQRSRTAPNILSANRLLSEHNQPAGSSSKSPESDAASLTTKSKSTRSVNASPTSASTASLAATPTATSKAKRFLLRMAKTIQGPAPDTAAPRMSGCSTQLSGNGTRARAQRKVSGRRNPLYDKW